VVSLTYSKQALATSGSQTSSSATAEDRAAGLVSNEYLYSPEKSSSNKKKQT